MDLKKAVAGEMQQIAEIQPKQPYNFGLMLDVLSRFAHPTLDFVRDGAYWRVLRVGDGLTLVKVAARADGGLDVHQAGVGTPEDVLKALQMVLPMEYDPAAFLMYARGNEPLWKVIAPLAGLPETRSATLFEALMQAVIEQQISWVTAQRAQRWLVEWAGNAVEYDGQAYYAFPTPAQIAAATVEDLKPLKITFKRMALMIDIAGQVADGRLDLEGLRDLPMEAAYQRLVAIKGIGHWTAAVALSRACGSNYVAHNDVALQAAVNRYFYGGKGRIPGEQVTATFAPYGVHAGTAAHYTLIRWVLDEYPVVANG